MHAFGSSRQSADVVLQRTFRCHDTCYRVCFNDAFSATSVQTMHWAHDYRVVTNSGQRLCFDFSHFSEGRH